MPDSWDVVVIGSGLAGLSAAIEAAEAFETGPAPSVLLLEKEATTGGNSSKASSGINALALQAGDTPEAYQADTLRSGKGLSDELLVQRLVVGAPLSS